jgi:hypothetical protein
MSENHVGTTRCFAPLNHSTVIFAGSETLSFSIIFALTQVWPLSGINFSSCMRGLCPWMLEPSDGQKEGRCLESM